MSGRLLGLSAGAIALALLVTPDPRRADCTDAARRHAAAVVQVIEALRGYARCIAASAGTDDCAGEIRALDDAHDRFADAVEDMKACP